MHSSSSVQLGKPLENFNSTVKKIVLRQVVIIVELDVDKINLQFTKFLHTTLADPGVWSLSHWIVIENMAGLMREGLA